MVTWTNFSIYTESLFGSLPILFIALVVGVAILSHSFYLHRTKWKYVRVANDVAAIGLISESICYLICANNKCSLKLAVILENFLANGFFSLLVSIPDYALTYSRYAVVVGGVSNFHKILTFLYVSVLLYLSWWLFIVIFPFHSDMNNSNWKSVFSCLYFVRFIAAFCFDCVYLALLGFAIRKAMRRTQSNQRTYMVLALRAIGHTLASLLGNLLSFWGPVVGDIIGTIGIHIFLNWNWKFNSSKLRYRVMKVAPNTLTKITPFSQTTKANTSH